jgi:hypothetical protein
VPSPQTRRSSSTPNSDSGSRYRAVENDHGRRLGRVRRRRHAASFNFILKKDFEGVDMDFHYTTTEQGDGAETRFTTLLGCELRQSQGQRDARHRVVRPLAGAAQDRDFYRNGWFDKGSDAGGFIQMPGYSPASAVLGSGAT